ncbi:unnamed protein product [Spirodela intermedia]|uniref:non-specific serine/threonine protein kinase n=1 Tax=Spirodela intermedia TaxID=51605 RepID=A0A7I8JUV5_SPIIN|nr:unnamed protein product [Spirodela intermedia]CAA6673535.1 unnamed protein product [Spirodela intermedia]
MDDNESCCSWAMDTDPVLRRRHKLDIYHEVLRRLRNCEDAGLPGFDDELWVHFNRLPIRYALDVNVETAEDVLMHKCLLQMAADSSKRPVFHVRLVQLQISPVSDDIHPPPAFGSSSNLEALALEGNRTCVQGVHSTESANFHCPRHMHEITFAAYDKPRLLSQLTCLLAELGLNIQEAHAFSTNDGYSLDVFVVEGWPYEESERLRHAIQKGVHKFEKEVPPISYLLLPTIQDEQISEEPSPDHVQIPTDGTDEWEVDVKLLKFGRKLASGSYGDLYRGTYCNQDVTIKVLNPEHLTAEMQREFAQEVYIMRKVRHKNVVQFIGACTRFPNMLIVTEFMSGGSLHDFLHKENGMFKLPVLLRVALDISKGMNYLHQSNIIHRDLKSANLLMDENEVVKVADFGVARVKAEPGVMTSETGTYRWMAPEVIEHRPYDQKADVFSFGIVLWELLTGKLPYENLTPLQAAVGVVQKGLRPSIPESTHPRLAALLERCWHQDRVGDEKPAGGFLASLLRGY